MTSSYIVVLVLSWSLPMLLPVFTLPAPTGKFKIGTKYIHIKTDRPELITQDQKDQRELMLKVWYPAQITEEGLEDYLDKGSRLGFATKYGLPAWSMNYLDFIKTHTYIQPAIAKGKFPVLIFSHGHYSNAFGYYSLLEEIVSQGYIVININHTYESTGSIFPNGEIKLYNTTYDSLSNNSEQAEMVWNATQQFQQAENTEEEYQAIKDILTDYVAAKSIQRWSNDISSVIDHLENDKQLSFIATHMKKSGIGVFGHSHGGAAAGQALLDDKRIEAAINIDGTQWGDMINSTLNKAFASISSAWPEEHPNFNNQAFRNKSNADFYNIRINNTGHSNFMDIPLMVNVPAINEAGDMAPFKAYEITNSLILKFFNKYLLNKQNNIYAIENKFEEVSIQTVF
ncbi:carboxylic ester hydrolase [Zunongwangia atlantica 22II14-10F7]|uniref:Carboxylic ester hydrolase n=2 Tax=Zunongwangia TaxID=417127 RepID=A0A1Y1T1M9_9FLAO|nr:carboxylic ester hydrolase [Zunongwangia atlantica 22II14-10F7]